MMSAAQLVYLYTQSTTGACAALVERILGITGSRTMSEAFGSFLLLPASSSAGRFVALAQRAIENRFAIAGQVGV